MHVLCESNYPIDTITIHLCHHFKLSSLLPVIDTFQLRELDLILYDENLLSEEDPGVSGKAVFLQFMRKLMKSSNMLRLKYLSLELSSRTRSTITFDQNADEREIIDHWLFPFPELRTLTLNISLNVDPLVMHVLIYRIFKHCPKLEELGWNNNHAGTCSKYHLMMIHHVRNQCLA